jgi:hypothetical protein
LRRGCNFAAHECKKRSAGDQVTLIEHVLAEHRERELPDIESEP